TCGIANSPFVCGRGRGGGPGSGRYVGSSSGICGIANSPFVCGERGRWPCVFGRSAGGGAGREAVGRGGSPAPGRFVRAVPPRCSGAGASGGCEASRKGGLPVGGRSGSFEASGSGAPLKRRTRSVPARPVGGGVPCDAVRGGPG